MRIIGQIEHPSLKISIFKNDGRISVKLENAGYEQTFKLGEDERFTSVEGIEKLFDAGFLEKILEGFQQMHQNKLAALGRNFPPNVVTVFDEII